MGYLNDPRCPALNSFTDDDRRACLPILVKIDELSRLSRNDGLLSLENVACYVEPLFFRNALRMVIDGVPESEIRPYLETYMRSSSYTGAEYLKRVVILEGVCLIARGENPLFIRERLLAILGEEFYPQAEAALK